MPFFDTLPVDAGIGHLFDINPDIRDGFMKFSQAVMRGESPFSIAEREPIAADADAVYAAGWDERARSDAIWVCARFNMMNRLALGHGLAADPAAFEARAKNMDYEKRQIQSIFTIGCQVSGGRWVLGRCFEWCHGAIAAPLCWLPMYRRWHGRRARPLPSIPDCSVAAGFWAWTLRREAGCGRAG